MNASSRDPVIIRRLALIVALVLCLVASACQSELPTSVADDQTRPAPTQPNPVAADTTPQAVTQSDTDFQPVAPGDYTIRLDHGRRERSYIMHVPELAPGPVPVVIGLHGGGGNGRDFQDQNGFDAIADREGFIAVYPEGTGVLPNLLHTWNSGVTCCGYALDRNVDDVGFLRAVITDLKVRVNADPGRVYMTGHSNGAMMAYRFAVEESELVTAIVPVGGAIDLPEPLPTEPVAMLHIHSLDDPRALYQGGDGPPFPGTDRTVHHEPVRAGVDAWASASGCGSTPHVLTTAQGTGASAAHSMELLAWPDCTSGIGVQHMVLSGTGHGWPGVTNRPRLQRHLGPPTNVIDASEEVWAFVSKFHR